jgi:fermentation-respiration switch protein FrsA (DUF1100 family)
LTVPNIRALRNTAKWFLRILAHVAVVWLALFLMFQWFEGKITYHPPRRLVETPSDRGMAFEDVFMETEDGLAVHGWWIPAPAIDADDSEEQAAPPTVLEFHGNAENISYGMDQHAAFHGLGWNQLVVDYRGYGRSEGGPSEEGLYRDGDAAYAHVRARGVPPERIVIYGRSLGGAVAVYVAHHHPVAALVTEGLFTDTHRVGRDILPFIPVRLFIKKRFDSLSRVSGLRVPKLFMHAAHDEVIPVHHAERLFEAAAPPKELFWIPGAGHNDAFYTATEDYLVAVKRFVETHVQEISEEEISPI